MAVSGRYYSKYTDNPDKDIVQASTKPRQIQRLRKGRPAGRPYNTD